MSAKCELCHKKIEYLKKECDGSGLAWHMNCFRCYVCRVPLNEKGVNIRGDDNSLYCGSHVIFQEGYQVTEDVTMERTTVISLAATARLLITAGRHKPKYKNMPVPVCDREGFWRTITRSHNSIHPEIDWMYWRNLLKQKPE